MKRIAVNALYPGEAFTVAGKEDNAVLKTSDALEINISDFPKHDQDTICRVLIRSVTEAFKNPKVASDYQHWLAERYKE